MRGLLLAGWLFVVPLHAAETGYRIVHPDGTVEYTDQPGQKALEVPLPEVNTYPAEFSPSPTVLPPTPSEPDESDTARNGEDYTLFTISAPQNNETIWFDEKGINVVVRVAPGLAKGDKVVVDIDGEIVASGVVSSYQIQDIYRGTHTLSAVIRDSQGTVIKEAGPIVFYVRQHSKLHSQDPRD